MISHGISAIISKSTDAFTVFANARRSVRCSAPAEGIM